jgi:hypothetical protein
VTDQGARPVLFAVCVDANGDGLCEAGSDPMGLCATGPAGSGGASLAGGPCSVYEDPAAADPTVYVTLLSGVFVDTSGSVSLSAPTAGTIGFA